MTARADLQCWNHFLQLWNGVSIFPTSLPKCNVFTDASGSFGCGAFDPCLGTFQVQWPATWADVDISVKEVVPLVFAAALWGPAWTGCHVQFHVDNMAVVAVIQKRLSQLESCDCSSLVGLPQSPMRGSCCGLHALWPSLAS